MVAPGEMVDLEVRFVGPDNDYRSADHGELKLELEEDQDAAGSVQTPELTTLPTVVS